MDETAAPVEEIQRRCDSAATAAKSSGSLIHINSIAIDLCSAVEEIESPGHEHFSIRGFVAGMRKKDQKVCSLFGSECNDMDLVASMPQLHAPKFRWWHCSKCIPEISNERTTIETMLADRSDAGTSSCKHVDEREGFSSYNREKSGRKWKTDIRINEGGNSCTNTTQAHPLQVKERDSNSAAGQVEEPENSSLGYNNGALVPLPQRRKQKLRSLADIIEEERNSNNHHFKAKSTSCSGMQSTSTRVEALLAPRLRLDAPADVAKGARSFHEKRKFSLEDREPLKTTYASKRLKGLPVEAERACRGVHGSDSESNLDASKGLESEIGARNRQSRPKKNKALEVNKRIRPANIGNSTVKIQEMRKVDSLQTSNSSIQAVADDTRLCKLGRFPSTPRELRPSTSRSLALGKLAEKNSDQSVCKQLEVKDDHNPSKSHEESIFVERNIEGKDGSMNVERNSDNRSCFRLEIPDLNETFSQKTATERGKRSPTASEKSNLPMLKSLDISVSCMNEGSSKVNRQLGVPQLPTGTGKNIEFGETSDDIPMEIVELLVRTKREKELENLRKQFPPKGFSAAIRGSPSLYAEACPRIDAFPLTNTKTGATVSNGNMCFTQSIPVNFPRLDGSQFGTRRQEEGQFKLFDRYPSQQWKPPYSALSSIRSSSGADLFWPPRRENAPFHFSTMQNYPIDRNIMGVDSFSDMRHKGKTISDIKCSERKKAAHIETRIGSSSNSVGSVDPYSNDAIPAMQLLSLMDRGIVSSSSVKVGPKSCLDKPFAPCNHHPRLNEKENQSFFRTSFFPLNNHSNGFPLFSHGTYFPGESSKKASSFIQGQMLPYQEKAASMYVVNQPARSKSEAVLCVLNKNPADFSIPEARNEFTISAKDLKPRKVNASKERAHSAFSEGMRRRRSKKNALGKECSKKMQETVGIA